jgi:nitroreductase
MWSELMTSARFQSALEAATLAPSPHNTQPWRFELSADHVDLFLDESRILHVADPQGREATMSCAAALFNLRISLRSQGLPVHWKLLPDPSRPQLLARVRVGGHLAAKADERLLAEAIPLRHTNRRPFEEQPVSSEIQKALRQAALCEGGRLVLIDQPARYSAVATLLRLAEFAQREDIEFQDELRHWVAEEASRLDGVPPLMSGPPPITAPLVPLREYGNGAKAPRNYEQEPLLAVLVTQHDTVRDHLHAGQAMQRVLLAVTACQLSASFLSAAVELPASRASLAALLGGGGYPQVVLRLGYGYPAPHTRRRPVGEVALCVESSKSAL